MTNAVAELKATPPEADPPVLSYQFEEQQRKLDREMMYLINKLKTHPPPKPKTPVNTSNTTEAPLEEVYTCMYTSVRRIKMAMLLGTVIQQVCIAQCHDIVYYYIGGGCCW